MDNITNIYKRAKQLDVCSMFTGTENSVELMQLMLTPQGIEFCTKNSFPELPLMREFKGVTAEELGIYIDTDCELNNVPKVILAGNTHAQLNYNDPSKRHEVVLMHGAKAEIRASNWAVVFVTGFPVPPP